MPSFALPPACAAVVCVLACAPDQAGDDDAADFAQAYEKRQEMVEMRDGVRLHTTLYIPRDRDRPFPILMRRTPYSRRPYGSGDFPEALATRYLLEDGYVFVCQDVRGRWMSEGDYDNMRPHVAGELPVDESSDAYDTTEWLLENVPNHNGRVGMYGRSYPGFYAAAALPEAHPALVASSPQAPIADFFFDDFHHRGAFTLYYFIATGLFGYQSEGPTPEPWYEIIRPRTRDGYQFYKDLGPLSNADRYYGGDNFFWQQLREHPNYDEFWQRRDLLPHLRDIDDAVMVVGGWFDAENLYGPLNIYRTIEEENPDAFNVLVMGPWTHGDWNRDVEHQIVGDIWFGDDISDFFQREVEAPFFRHFLHGMGEPPDFEALVYDTGRREWAAFDSWPPGGAVNLRFYLKDDELLSTAAPTAGEAPFTEYISDPQEPVPHTDRIRLGFTPRPYMAEDQRFAERRPDVIEFQTSVLEEPMTLAGPITAHLQVSTTGTDADWVVKLIDVYPPDEPNNEHTPSHIELSGYQQMVRSEIMRGRFRDSFEEPKPFVPGEITVVEFPLQDVFHTFRAGHRIMVQVQSTWFPLFDRNPQTFVANIFDAEEEDFVAATHKVYHRRDQRSWVDVAVLPEGNRNERVTAR